MTALHQPLATAYLSPLIDQKALFSALSERKLSWDWSDAVSQTWVTECQLKNNGPSMEMRLLFNEFGLALPQSIKRILIAPEREAIKIESIEDVRIKGWTAFISSSMPENGESVVPLKQCGIKIMRTICDGIFDMRYVA